MFFTTACSRRLISHVAPDSEPEAPAQKTRLRNADVSINPCIPRDRTRLEARIIIILGAITLRTRCDPPARSLSSVRRHFCRLTSAAIGLPPLSIVPVGSASQRTLCIATGNDSNDGSEIFQKKLIHSTLHWKFGDSFRARNLFLED